jgi:hypothetical protein
MKLCFYQCCGSGPNSDPDPPACNAWMLKPFLKRQNCPNSVTNHQTSVLLRKLSVLTEVRGLALKGIDRPFQGGVKNSLIRSLFINWRLGNFFSLILKGFHHKISKKPKDAA